MANLKEVKTRINSVISTQQITKAMKMVAAAKLRRAQDSILQMRPYAAKLGEVLANVSAGLEQDQNVYGAPREINRVLLVVISSDRGLCGPFNSNVFKLAVEHIRKNYAAHQQAGDLQIMPVGKKSLEFFRKRGYHVIDQYAGLFSQLSFDNVRKAAEFIMKNYAEGQFDRVDLVYNTFKNVATQILTVEQYLPVKIEAGEEDMNLDYIYQPDQETLIRELIPKSLKVQFYKAILESNAAEHGARMTAMDKATENADELLRDLRLTYNQTRQAAITKEILEIVAGAEALG